MHIIFLTHYFPPEVNAPASRTYENCTRWAANGHRVTVITCVPNTPDGIIYKGYKNRLYQWEEMDMVRVLRVWTYVTPNKGIIRRTLNFITYMLFSLFVGLFVKNGDIIIATSPQFFCAIGGYILSCFKQLPFIMEVRDLWPESIVAVEAFTHRKLIKIFENLEIWLYNKAKYIVVVTESFKRIIAKKGISDEKIFVVKNGVDLDVYNPRISGRAMRKKLHMERKFVVSYIGTIGMAHALHHLLNVAQRLRHLHDIAFLLVGSGALRQFLTFEKEKRSLENVFFLGRQPKEKTPLFYAASDVCLVPLKKDPLFKSVIPSKMFEVMAMAKPIILSVDGEAREILAVARAGIYIQPENEDQLVNAILRLRKNKRNRIAMGRNGNKYVKKHCNRDELAHMYLNIISQGVT